MKSILFPTEISNSKDSPILNTSKEGILVCKYSKIITLVFAVYIEFYLCPIELAAGALLVTLPDKTFLKPANFCFDIFTNNRVAYHMAGTQDLFRNVIFFNRCFMRPSSCLSSFSAIHLSMMAMISSLSLRFFRLTLL